MPSPTKIAFFFTMILKGNGLVLPCGSVLSFLVNKFQWYLRYIPHLGGGEFIKIGYPVTIALSNEFIYLNVRDMFNMSI